MHSEPEAPTAFQSKTAWGCQSLPVALADENVFSYFISLPEIIGLTVKMYVRYPQSLRQIEDLLFERSIDICHETVRGWWNRFATLFAAEIKKTGTIISVFTQIGDGISTKSSWRSMARQIIFGVRLITKVKLWNSLSPNVPIDRLRWHFKKRDEPIWPAKVHQNRSIFEDILSQET